MFVSLFNFVSDRLRLSKPWKYKVPLLISFPYFIALHGNLSHDDFLYSIIASYTTIIGFLGIAYLNNDLSDRKQDKLALKDNSLKSKPKWQIALLYVLFTILAFYPWKFLPLDSISLGLIVLELSLFYLYSFPPFRLKEKGFLGIIADALYAHVIPAILASWTFYLLIEKSYSQFYPFLICLAVWQFCSGVRNIISHQIKDYENDLKSETKTWLVAKGIEESTKVFKNYIIPLELVSFLVFLITIQLEIIYLFPVVIVYWIYSAWQFKKRKEDKSETIEKHFTNLFLDDFYIKLLPYLILSGMVFILTEVRAVLLIHILLFFSPINNWFVSKIKILHQKIINHQLISIFFAFRGYYKGLAIHLAFLLSYTSIFIAIYFALEHFVQDNDIFFKTQKTLSKTLVLFILGHLLLFFIFRRNKSIAGLREFIFEKNTAINLAIARIIAFYLITKSYNYAVFGSFKAWTYLPDTSREGLPFISWIIELIPINPELYYTLGIIGFILSICGLLGFQTKWTLKLYIPIALYLWGVPCFFGKLNHHHIMVWIPIILAFSPCSDTLSIDSLIRWIRKRKLKPTHPVNYGLPFTFIWITFGIIYACSGFHKLWDTGLYWALSDNLTNQIQLEWVENYDIVPNFRIDDFPILLKLSGIGVILFEILYPLFLIKPATRFINLLGASALHLGTSYFLNIDFVFLRKIQFTLINWGHFISLLNPFKKEHNLISPVENKSSLNTKLLIIGSVLIVMNLLFGILSISSWPFSSYPAYSGIVKDKVHILEMRAYDKTGNSVNVKAIGEKANFRWEDIRPFEVKIAASVLKGDTTNINQKLKDYWALWKTKVPELEMVTQLEVDLVTTGIAPEERKYILNRISLGSINISD